MSSPNQRWLPDLARTHALVEVACAAALVTLRGGSYSSEIITDVLIRRGLTYLLPIVVGAGG